MSRRTLEHPPGYRDGRLFFDGEASGVLRTAFDVAAYTSHARGRIDVDAEAVELDPETRADLDFLWRIETAALGDMRSMLASWTSKEARITAFLGTWAYERHWNAHAVRQLLKAAGPAPGRRKAQGIRSRLRHAYVQYLLPGIAPVVGITVGEPVTAGQMARMAVHEGALQVAYREILPRLGSGARRTVEEVVERRETFLEFFRLEAAERIRRSRAEALSARLHLVWPWSPMRPDSIAQPDEGQRLTSIFRDPASRTRLAHSDAEGAHGLGVAPSVAMVGASMRGARSAEENRSRRGL